MTNSTKQFLLSLLKDIRNNNIDHDCGREDGCTYCFKAQEPIDEINKIETDEKKEEKFVDYLDNMMNAQEWMPHLKALHVKKDFESSDENMYREEGEEPTQAEIIERAFENL